MLDLKKLIILDRFEKPRRREATNKKRAKKKQESCKDKSQGVMCSSPFCL
jgi:hypothetical protein